jgi:hypothetical protein
MKLVNENIDSFLTPKSREQIISELGGRDDIFFKRSKKDSASFGLIGTFPASYKTLVQLFGKPEDGDEKVSTSWVVEDNIGRVISIYDWKMTKLYEPDGMSVTGFRNLPYFDSWHVGGNSNLAVKIENINPFDYILGRAKPPVVKDLMVFILRNESNDIK